LIDSGGCTGLKADGQMGAKSYAMYQLSDRITAKPDERRPDRLRFRRLGRRASALSLIGRRRLVSLQEVLWNS
jgi:hypothetical protein